MIVQPNGAPCGCGQLGCLEAIASGVSIARRAAELHLEGAGAGAPPADAEAVAALAAKGVGPAKQAMEEAVEALAIACGGVATTELVAAVDARRRELAWTILPDVVQLRLASAGADAGVLGAAASAAAGAPPPASSVAGFTVRRALAADRDGAFRVCLLTGDAGADATSQYPTDPDALGKRWVGPYLDLEPDFAFVLTDAHDSVVGYCLAARESRDFARRLREAYLPLLRAAHTDPIAEGKEDEAMWTPEEHVYHELHETMAGEPPAGLDLSQYPSHLHIDLLPVAQGCGQGLRMMQNQLRTLRERGSPGVYLQMHESNARARRFYAKLGFEELKLKGDAESGGGGGTGGDLYLGLRL
jgi:ribosomal protein S18 acetylase RimI-like enzyme